MKWTFLDKLKVKTPSDLPPSPDEPIIPAGTSEIEDCIEEIEPDEKRDILIEQTVYGYTAKEISEKRGKPMGTILSWLSKAKSQLRDCLELDFLQFDDFCGMPLFHFDLSLSQSLIFRSIDLILLLKILSSFGQLLNLTLPELTQFGSFLSLSSVCITQSSILSQKLLVLILENSDTISLSSLSYVSWWRSRSFS